MIVIRNKKEKEHKRDNNFEEINTSKKRSRFDDRYASPPHEAESSRTHKIQRKSNMTMLDDNRVRYQQQQQQKQPYQQYLLPQPSYYQFQNQQYHARECPIGHIGQ